MGATPGSTIRTVADVILTLTKCTKEQANAAEQKFCSDPKRLKTLLAACGLGKYSVGVGGVLTIAGVASSGTTLIPGLALTGAGLFTARKYCYEFVDRATALGDIVE